MSHIKAKFPLWDGTSPSRLNRLDRRAPDSEDWDQIVAEVLAQQASGSGGETLAETLALGNTADRQINWGSGLGVIDHLLGPSDQAFRIDSVAGINIGIGTATEVVIGRSGVTTRFEAGAFDTTILDGTLTVPSRVFSPIFDVAVGGGSLLIGTNNPSDIQIGKTGVVIAIGGVAAQIFLLDGLISLEGDVSLERTAVGVMELNAATPGAGGVGTLRLSAIFSPAALTVFSGTSLTIQTGGGDLNLDVVGGGITTDAATFTADGALAIAATGTLALNSTTGSVTTDATSFAAAAGLTIQTGGGDLNFDVVAGGLTTDAATFTADGAFDILTTGPTALGLDAGGAAAVNVGGVNAVAVNVGRTGQSVGFLGATAASRVADSVALTDSTGGTANNTVAAVSGSGADAIINDNFADLTAKYNVLRDFARAHGLMA